MRRKATGPARECSAPPPAAWLVYRRGGAASDAAARGDFARRAWSFCSSSSRSSALICFPTKLTYISVMSVAAELGIVSIGVTLADDRRSLRSVGRRGARPHLLRRGRADARRSDCRRSSRRRRPSPSARRLARSTARSWSVPHPLLRRDARDHADLARRGHRPDRRISDHGRHPARVQRRHVGAAARRVPDVDGLVLRASARSAPFC